MHATVWVAVQYYEGSGEVILSVVDNGCGFLRTLATHSQLREHTHIAAIKTALIPKVSCNRDGPYVYDEGNQGVGLTTTARIAAAAKGRLQIASGNAHFQTDRSGEGNKMPPNGRWEGVAIAFSCRRSALPAVNLRNLMPVERAHVPVQFVD